jgi:hypothetical protein
LVNVRASHQYDNSYDPAAPILPIGLGPSGENSIRRELVAFVDTGSDVTMIPTTVLRAAGGRLLEKRNLRGILGDPVPVNLYLIAVHIGDIAIHGIHAAALKDNREAILGRDVLNQLEIILNGPAQELWVA